MENLKSYLYMELKVSVAITSIFPIEDIRKGLLRRTKGVLEKVKKVIGESELLSNDVENIHIIDEDVKCHSNGRTLFDKNGKMHVEIYVVHLKRDIDQIIQFSLRNNFNRLQLFNRDVLWLYPEFVLAHELTHVWQISNMGFDNFERIKCLEEKAESIAAYRSYEILADHIAKAFLISEYGDNGKLISDIAITRHRYGTDEEKILRSLTGRTTQTCFWGGKI